MLQFIGEIDDIQKVKRQDILGKGWQLPASVSTPKIELTEWGGCLPSQDYFPMYLGNGRDAMLINLMGSEDAHWEEEMRVSQPLTRLLNTEWYKADHRDYRHR